MKHNGVPTFALSFSLEVGKVRDLVPNSATTCEWRCNFVSRPADFKRWVRESSSHLRSCYVIFSGTHPILIIYSSQERQWLLVIFHANCSAHTKDCLKITNQKKDSSQDGPWTSLLTTTASPDNTTMTAPIAQAPTTAHAIHKNCSTAKIKLYDTNKLHSQKIFFLVTLFIDRWHLDFGGENGKHNNVNYVEISEVVVMQWEFSFGTKFHLTEDTLCRLYNEHVHWESWSQTLSKTPHFYQIRL